MARQLDDADIQAALIGYQSRLTAINTAIAEIQKKLARRHRDRSRIPEGAELDRQLRAAIVRVPLAPKKSRHRITPEGRERIAAAQRKRWAIAKKQAAA